MIGHDVAAGPAQRGEITGLLVAELLVGVVVSFDGDALAAAVADRTAKTGRLKLGEPNRIRRPLAAADVMLVVHAHVSPLRIQNVIEMAGKAIVVDRMFAINHGMVNEIQAVFRNLACAPLDPRREGPRWH